MAAKNYTNNKEQHVYISIYMHHLHYILVIPFFNQCSNSEVSMWISYFLFYTYKHFCIIRTCRYIQYTNIPTVFIEFYFKSMEKNFAITTPVSMWNKKWIFSTCQLTHSKQNPSTLSATEQSLAFFPAASKQKSTIQLIKMQLKYTSSDQIISINFKCSVHILFQGNVYTHL